MVNIREFIKYAKSNEPHSDCIKDCFCYDRISNVVLAKKYIACIEIKNDSAKRFIPIPVISSIDAMNSFIAKHSEEIKVDEQVYKLSGIEYISALRWTLHDNGLLDEYDMFYMNMRIDALISWCKSNQIDYFIRGEDSIRDEIQGVIELK